MNRDMPPTVELTRAETTLMRKCLLPLISHGGDQPPKAHGTCEVIATMGRMALALTARHVLDEIARDDGSYDEQLHIPDVLRGDRRDSELRKRHAASVYQLTDNTICGVRYRTGWVSETHDVALCLLELDSDAPADAHFEVRMPVSFAPVAKGVSVQIGGYSKMNPPKNPTPNSLELSMTIELQLAEIVEVHYPHGRQKSAGPVVTANVECPHGTSGGPMILHDNTTNEAIVCGVVSYAQGFGDPETHAGVLWPALGLKIKGVFERDVTLLDLVAKGFIDDRSAALEHAALVPLPDGKVGVIWR